MKRAIATVSASIAAITLSAPPASAATVHFGFDEVCFVLASGEQLCSAEDGQYNYKEDRASGVVTYSVKVTSSSRLLSGGVEVDSRTVTSTAHAVVKDGESMAYHATYTTVFKATGTTCTYKDAWTVTLGEIRHLSYDVKCTS